MGETFLGGSFEIINMMMTIVEGKVKEENWLKLKDIPKFKNEDEERAKGIMTSGKELVNLDVWG
ncbi:hypothetical protein A2686_05360 [Candidatus Woesebacteria bacterium RIFCSPHIGHO2_01_FULL_38_10]|uniref:Uncharacterized protein n=1 Tax=Candidatus Woesebacteria bacterium RIFCSPLOWO2_01_FULL_39_10b TaxID=1802517 RepID=A0A1F8B791_9BACT|nr:MAG: hypothetical protein A2686_05360 [Candidatus Woesebacteria bacterium RIFCSPHIGHO2_01_FULL_38_10]OGM59903.1 MAG: hypothetical protein A2892_02885 [Candidatus Woesebacteria bacterium RIFCSPLOWO2_01_FULL_39_10b]